MQSGNYTCQPSNMRSDSVIVTILAENKSPNALQVIIFKLLNQYALDYVLLKKILFLLFVPTSV